MCSSDLLLRPVVWLPLSLLARLPAEQVEALIAHELAHIARLDWLWNGVQCVIESLLFFHPAAWWLSRRIRLSATNERELCLIHASVLVRVDAIATSSGNRHVGLMYASSSISTRKPTRLRAVLAIVARIGRAVGA